VLGRLEKSLLGPPIPVVATFQVELIRLGLRPRGAELRRARPGGRLRPKAPDDAGDDVLLDWIDVVDGVLVPPRPHLFSARPDQIWRPSETSTSSRSADSFRLWTETCPTTTVLTPSSCPARIGSTPAPRYRATTLRDITRRPAILESARVRPSAIASAGK